MKDETVYLIKTIIVVLAVFALLMLVGLAVYGQEMPNIAATEAIYDIYRVPEPMPLAPSVAIYIDDNGHMVAKDETGARVNFTTLCLNCEIMARDFDEMAKMLRKIGDMARGSEENPDEGGN